MKNKLLLLSLVFAVVFVAGCTDTGGGGGTTSSNAIIITSFGPELSEIEPTDDAVIHAVIENIGGAKARGIQAKLFGLTDEWKFDSSTPRVQGVDDMLPPDPDRNLKGDVVELDWFLSPPKKKDKLPYDMELRVFFDYETRSESLLRVATRAYIDQFPSDQKQAEREKLGVSTSVASSGPISVVVSARSFVLDEAKDKMTVTVDIQNVGGGKPNDDKIGITIKSVDQNLDCTGIENGEVRLSQGKSRQLRCTVNIAGVIRQGWESVPISIKLSYNYWVSSFSTITVLGKEIE